LSAKSAARERSLFAEGIVPERRVQEAEAGAAEDSARRRQAEAALRMAGLDAASIQRVAGGGSGGNALTLTARSGGIVSDLDLRSGQRVKQGDTLMRIADPRKLSLEIQLPASRQGDLASLKGAPVVVVDRDAAATIRSFGTSISDSQVVTVRADVSRGAGTLRPGEFIQVKVPFASQGLGWAVPLQSVVRQGDQAYIFVRTQQGFVATPVKVLASAGQSVRVDGALKAGQEFAISSVIALKAAWQGKGGGS
jgi:multidrug efflux pump subunit AcrA (membrane-fusion protein)